MMADDRWALVVGASRGLGLGVAAGMQPRGWDGVGTVRDEAGERRLEKLARKPGGEIRVERLDINDDAQIAALRRRFDDLEFDLVFVNAGIDKDEIEFEVVEAAAQRGDLRVVVDVETFDPDLAAGLPRQLLQPALTGLVAHRANAVPAARLHSRRDPQPQPARRPDDEGPSIISHH